jgi:hypothetical protein
MTALTAVDPPAARAGAGRRSAPETGGTAGAFDGVLADARAAEPDARPAGDRTPAAPARDESTADRPDPEARAGGPGGPESTGAAPATTGPAAGALAAAVAAATSAPAPSAAGTTGPSPTGAASPTVAPSAPATDVPVGSAVPLAPTPATHAPAVPGGPGAGPAGPPAVTTPPATPAADAATPGIPAAGTSDAGSTPDARSGSVGTPEVASPPASAGMAVPPAPPPVAATAATSSATPSGPPAPAAQIATCVVPLRREADGVHRLTVHLHPLELGPVSVVAEVRDGTVHLQLSGATEVGRDALRGALTDLRRELLDHGFTGCSLDLRQDAPPGGQFRPPDRAAPTSTDRPAPVTVTATPGGPTGSDGHRLDLHL